MLREHGVHFENSRSADGGRDAASGRAHLMRLHYRMRAEANWENWAVSRRSSCLSLRPPHDGELRSSPQEHVVLCFMYRVDVVPKVVSAS